MSLNLRITCAGDGLLDVFTDGDMLVISSGSAFDKSERVELTAEQAWLVASEIVKWANLRKK